MSLQSYCRQYRKEVGATLREIEGSKKIAALSAFEKEDSTNLTHFVKYLHHAMVNGHFESFVTGLESVVRENI